MIHDKELDATISELNRNYPNQTERPTSSTAEYAKLPQQTGPGPASVTGHAADPKSKPDIFLEWLLVDSSHREPRTETELARLLNVDIRTLMRWKESPEFVSQFKDRLRTRYIYELPAIFSALITSAKSGDVPAVRLCLQLLGMIPGPELKLEASSMSLEEALRENSENWEPPTWALEEQRASTMGLTMGPHSPELRRPDDRQILARTKNGEVSG